MRQKPRTAVRGLFALAALASAGCQLNEVRSTHGFGAEWRHQGEGRTEHQRFSVEPGLEFVWDNGVETGLSYRRRDDNEGPGNHDDGLFVQLSFPLWKRPKEKDTSELRIAELERRLSALEARSAAPQNGSVTD